jgi:hypothetical protein
LVGWPPYQADQKKTAKNIVSFFRSLVPAAPVALGAAA